MTSKKTTGELRRRAEEIDRERIRQTPEIMESLSPEAAWQRKKKRKKQSNYY